MADLIPTGAPAPLVPTFTGTLAGVEQTLVDARTLHGALEVPTRFNDWIRDRIEQHLLVEDEDFYSVFSKTPGAAGRPSYDYHLSLDTAKHLALAERSERGRAVRQYFIDFERLGRGRLAALQEQVRQLQAERAQRALQDNPRLAQALRYHRIAQHAGLTHEECARLMGWKSANTWQDWLHKLTALGLIDYQPHPSRVAAGQRNMARLKAHALEHGPSSAQQASRRANAELARAAQAAQRAARKEG